MSPRAVELERRIDDLAREIGGVLQASEALDESLAESCHGHPYAVIVHEPDGASQPNREGVVVLEMLLRGAFHASSEGPELATHELPWVRALRGERTEREEIWTIPLGSRPRAWEVSSTPLGGGAALTVMREVTGFRARRAALEATCRALALEVAALGRVMGTTQARENGR